MAEACRLPGLRIVKARQIIHRLSVAPARIARQRLAPRLLLALLQRRTQAAWLAGCGLCERMRRREHGHDRADAGRRKKKSSETPHETILAAASAAYG
jgi:hypothetical protein